MSATQILWFCLIAILFTGFFFLDGFDFGVGMALGTLAHNNLERDQLVGTIGPVWDGNEVWLLAAGGAMFASYPYWYASLFSGYYLILLIILFGLIIRGVSFEFRHRCKPSHQKLWNRTLALGSFIVPFFFGVLFISLIQGMPIDAQGNMSAHFFDYINWFSIVGGIALTLLCYLHGLNYIALKTDGEVHYRARNYAQLLYWFLYLGLALFAILLYFQTDFFTVHPVAMSVLIIVMVVLTVIAQAAVFNNHQITAFVASGLTLASLVVLLFIGLFPRVMISSYGAKYDLLIKNATSSPYTLNLMSMIALTLIPIIIAYTIWAYYIFRKRIKLPRIHTGS